MNTRRFQIATLARKLYKGEATFEEFQLVLPEPDEDELIDWLAHLVEHEPKQGGFLGVSKKMHQEYMSQIFEAIEKLESDEA